MPKLINTPVTCRRKLDLVRAIRDRQGDLSDRETARQVGLPEATLREVLDLRQDRLIRLPTLDRLRTWDPTLRALIAQYVLDSPSVPEVLIAA